MISPLAHVDPSAQIGQNVVVHPFAYIQGDVVIGDDCVIMPNACILNGTKLGKGNKIYPNAVIGADPQSFHWDGISQPRVELGDYNVVRENVVIAGSNSSDAVTRIGSHNHLMNKVHICHDVQIGDGCVLGISSNVAGACIIGDYAILSSAAMVQRKVRVGKFALLQMGCRVQKDVMPYSILGGNPPAYHGVNTLLLTKHHPEIEEQDLLPLANAFRIITAGNFSLDDAILKIQEQIRPTPFIQELLHFLAHAERGVIRTFPS